MLIFSKDLEERLPKTKLTLLCNYQPVLDYVKDADHVVYQTLVETLIPEVLRPIPGKYEYVGINLLRGKDISRMKLLF
jgi:regulatory factor X 1/2/3